MVLGMLLVRTGLSECVIYFTEAVLHAGPANSVNVSNYLN